LLPLRGQHAVAPDRLSPLVAKLDGVINHRGSNITRPSDRNLETLPDPGLQKVNVIASSAPNPLDRRSIQAPAPLCFREWFPYRDHM
jgi:hypothetical protein